MKTVMPINHALGKPPGCRDVCLPYNRPLDLKKKNTAGPMPCGVLESW